MPTHFFFSCISTNRKRGGFQEETKEHEKWTKEKERKILNCVRATLNLKERTQSNGDFHNEVFVFRFLEYNFVII